MYACMRIAKVWGLGYKIKIYWKEQCILVWWNISIAASFHLKLLPKLLCLEFICANDGEKITSDQKDVSSVINNILLYLYTLSRFHATCFVLYKKYIHHAAGKWNADFKCLKGIGILKWDMNRMSLSELEWLGFITYYSHHTVSCMCM